MEVTGRAEVVKDPAERERAKQATMRTPSILDFGGDVARTSDSVLLRRRLGVWKEIVRWPTLTVSRIRRATAKYRSAPPWCGWGWSARAARTR